MANTQNILVGQLTRANRSQPLPAPLISRIKAFAEILSEVDPTPLSEIIDDFSRDENPEKEIQIWENIGSDYHRHVSDHPHLTLKEKKKVFSALLGASMGP